MTARYSGKFDRSRQNSSPPLVVRNSAWAFVATVIANTNNAIGSKRPTFISRVGPLLGSEIETLHQIFRIAQPGRGAHWNRIGQLREIVLGQPDRERADIFDESFLPLGAGNRHDVGAARQEPRQRQLAERAMPFPRDLF